MKKNLRIVSAAAAALLAVAPIAAAGVAPAATVSAAEPTPVHINGTVVLDRSTNTPFTVKLNDSQKEAILQQLGSIAANSKVSDMTNFRVTEASAPDVDGIFYQTIKFDLKGHDPQTAIVKARFAAQQGTPYFYNKNNNTVVNNGATVSLDNLGNGFTASDLLSDINSHYAWKTSDASNADAEMTTTASDVESQLVAQGLKRASNGNFDYPANGFNLKLTARSDSGETASITVRVNENVNFNAPVFVVNGQDPVYFNNNQVWNGSKNNFETSTHQIIFDYGKVYNKQNKKWNFSGVEAYVQSAYHAGSDNRRAFDTTLAGLNAHHQQKLNSSDLTIDDSHVNASVAGLYPVTITAKNPAGFTSKLIVYVVVNGPTEKAPLEYVKNDGVKIYNINGNNVSEDTTAKALAKGAGVYTFGKVTVNGVEYTRINSKDSNEFVKSSDLQATPVNVTPAIVASQSKTIMHAAYLYDKNGKRVGTDVLHAYNSVSVAEHTTTINGKAYYEVIKNGQASGNYIAAGNLDGSMRKLRHNAYVYNTKGHRVKSEGTKKKGTSMRTYGAALNYRGHKMYRVAQYRYVKAANF